MIYAILELTNMVCGEECLPNNANGFKAQLPSMLRHSHSGGSLNILAFKVLPKCLTTLYH